jgi:hypothetical protein
MSKLLFIDSDDILSLSEALREALERRGIRFCNNVEDVYIPANRSYVSGGGCGGHVTASCGGYDDRQLFQESGGNYGGCGSGGCGGHVSRRYGCGAGGC